MGEAEYDRYQQVAKNVYKACRISDTLFAMNPYLPQQNFYSQQLRALALVDVIQELHLPEGRRNVCVVGAGIAGRTLAAALVCVGASVTLIEAEEKGFERYRDAVHRELHPNIIFWPMQKPAPATALPFLNWGQAPASSVVEHLIDDWENSFAGKITYERAEVTAIEDDDTGVRILFKEGQPIRRHLCIVATGFRQERAMGDLASPSYWSTKSVADGDKSVLVSGTGDGGLIDVLSPLMGTKVTRAAHKLAIAMAGTDLEQDIRTNEAARFAIGPATDHGADYSFYQTAQISAEAARSIQDLVHTGEKLAGCTVTLVHNDETAFSSVAAPINKLLLAHFANRSSTHVRFVRGRLVDEEMTSGDGSEETAAAGAGAAGRRHFLTPEGGEKEGLDGTCGYDKIVVRHGAEPSLETFLKTHVPALKAQAAAHPGAAMIEDYNRCLYRWSNDGLRRSGVKLESLRRGVRRAIADIGSIYNLDIMVMKTRIDSFTDDKPIVVKLSEEDRKRADELKLFPMRVGPATVIVEPLRYTRNRPHVET